jgi:hypothetical protein
VQVRGEMGKDEVPEKADVKAKPAPKQAEVTPPPPPFAWLEICSCLGIAVGRVTNSREVSTSKRRSSQPCVSNSVGLNALGSKVCILYLSHSQLVNEAESSRCILQ